MAFSSCKKDDSKPYYLLSKYDGEYVGTKKGKYVFIWSASETDTLVTLKVMAVSDTTIDIFENGQVFKRGILVDSSGDFGATNGAHCKIDTVNNSASSFCGSVNGTRLEMEDFYDSHLGFGPTSGHYYKWDCRK